MKRFNERLAEYTGEDRNLVSNYDELAKLVGHKVVARRAKEESWENEDRTDVRKLEYLRTLIAEQLEEQEMAEQAHLPVISKFEAYQIAKKANVDTDERDAGIRMLAGMLKKHWAEDRDGDWVGNTVANLKKYFRANYPKSRVNDVFDIMAENGYSHLDADELSRIAENIVDQETFEYEIRRAGLDGASERHKQARKFLLAMVNVRDASGEQEPTDFITEPQDVVGEEDDEDKENKEAQMMSPPNHYDLLDLLRQDLDDTTILEELMKAMTDQEATENLAHIIQMYDLGSREEEADLEDEEDSTVGII